MEHPMRTVLGIVLVVAASPAFAQYKCTGADGKVAFQQTPCINAQEQQQAVRLRESGHRPAAAEKPIDSPYVRLNDRLSRENRVSDLEREIGALENGISNRNQQLALELDTLRRKKVYAKNNLAGATWEQSISGEMQAIATKYKSMNDVDLERVKQLRIQLDTAKRTKPGE
jgi:hypothetical protein